jgi:hypothetical protein
MPNSGIIWPVWRALPDAFQDALMLCIALFGCLFFISTNAS